MRGQAGLEFMASTIIVLLIVLVFYVSAFSRVNNTPNSMAAEQLCKSIATKMGSAAQFGDGFAQNVTLPANLQGMQYNVTVYTNSVICRTPIQDIVKPHTAKAVSNGTSGAPFTLPKRTISIRNDRDTIVIS